MAVIFSLVSIFLSFLTILSIGNLVRVINKKNAEVVSSIQPISSYMSELSQPLNAPIFTSYQVPAVSDGNVRVFGFVLYNSSTKQFQLIMTPATDIEHARRTGSEMIAKFVPNPYQWKILVEGGCDVKVDVPSAPAVVESKKILKPLDNFVYSLMYAKDRFAVSEVDKAVLNRIISDVEKNYGKKS